MNKTRQRKARLAHRGTGEEEEIAKKKTRMENKRVVVVDVFREGKADQQLREREYNHQRNYQKMKNIKITSCMSWRRKSAASRSRNRRLCRPACCSSCLELDNK